MYAEYLKAEQLGFFLLWFMSTAMIPIQLWSSVNTTPGTVRWEWCTGWWDDGNVMQKNKREICRVKQNKIKYPEKREKKWILPYLWYYMHQQCFHNLTFLCWEWYFNGNTFFFFFLAILHSFRYNQSNPSIFLPHIRNSISWDERKKREIRRIGDKWSEMKDMGH